MAKGRFQQLLEDKIGALRQRRLEDLGNGVDESQYRYHVGYLAGLSDAVKLCEEIEQETN